MNVDANAISYISTAIINLELQHNVKILCAVESGSRIWGFHSEDSDYDVRFIYVRPVADYLTVTPRRDTIEIPIKYDRTVAADLDMNGWDIKKALHLAAGSNRALVEWVQSPIIYKHGEDFETFKSFVLENVNLQGLYQHYSGWSRSIWSKETPTAKSYCYALRTALAAHYIYHYAKVPPVNIRDLMLLCRIGDEFESAVEALLNTKLAGREKDQYEKISIFDAFIDKAISRDASTIQKLDTRAVGDNVDDIFKQLIGFTSISD